MQKSLTKQLTSRLTALRMVSKNANMNFTKRLADGLVNSKLRYAIEIWSGTTKTNITKIQKIQNKTTRIVMGKEGSMKTDKQRLKTLGWKDIETMAKEATMKLVNKTLNTGKPDFFFYKIQSFQHKNLPGKKTCPLPHWNNCPRPQNLPS